MAQGMWRHPGITNACSLTVSLKQFDQGMIAEWFKAPFAFASHEKDQGTLPFLRALLHYIGTQGPQCFRFIEVYDSLLSRFGTHSLGMILAKANHHTPSAVLNVLQVQIENLTWSQPPLEHKQNHGLVSKRSQGAKERLDLILTQRTWYSLNGFHSYGTADGLLGAGVTHERTMTFRDPYEGPIIDVLDWILPTSPLPRENEILVEGGNSSKETINTGSGKPGCRLSCLGRAKDDTQSVPLLPARNGSEIG